MLFLDLPKELVDQVLEALVRDDVGEAFLARGACRYFKEKIETELITNTPLNQIEYIKHTRVHRWIKEAPNAMAYVSYRLKFRPRRPDNCKKLPQVLDKIVQELLRFKPTDDDETAAALRTDYSDKLLRVFASQLWTFEEGYIGDEGSRFAQLAGKYLSDKATDGIDMFGAAAAVGSLEALKHYVPHPDQWCGWETMLSPWSAAIVTGQTETIKFLLDRVGPIQPDEFQIQIPSFLNSSFQEAMKSHKVDIAKLFIDFFLDNHSIGQYDGVSTILMAMKHGSIEIFEYLHERVPNIEEYISDYYDLLCIGLTEACENGHSDFVRYFLQLKNAPTIYWIQGSYTIWNSFSGYDSYEVEDPVFAAAAASHLSVLDVLIDEYPSVLEYKGLMETAVLGFKYYEYADSGSKEDDEFWIQCHGKRGSSYAVAQFLIQRGIPITWPILYFTNYLAKVICRRPKLRSDFAMTLILLLATLKERFDPKRLRKQINVPVRKALRLIIEERPDMRPVGSQQYDFLGVARELIGWLNKPR